jgi:hypothetical protein
MLFADKLTLDAPRKTADGYLAVRAKASRTGVYKYTGAEVDPENKHGLRDQAVVNVLRDEATVFDKKAVHSFIGKPVTDNHPSAAVNADNWRDHARGVVMGAVRDGEHVAFDLLLTDAAAIGAVEAGKRELSNGYAADLEFGDYTAPDGTKCPVRQASIRGNHVAIVDQGRAGSECRIADAARCTSLPADAFELLLFDERTYNDKTADDKTSAPRRDDVDFLRRARDRQNGEDKMPHTLMIDGLQVTDVSDQAKVAIEKLQGQVKDLTDGKAKADEKVGELTATVSTKDGEIAALEQKLKDAEVKPEQLEKLAADRAALVATAKAIDPKVVTDGKTEAEIRQAVVEAKLGDSAKDLDEAAIGGAFKVLAKDVKQPDPVRDAIRDQADTKTDDAKVRDSYDGMLKDLAEASKPKHLQAA